MARKTNYAFDRNNRAKAKAAKREAKRQAKLAAKAEKAGTPLPEQGVEGAESDPRAAESGQDSRQNSRQDNRADGPIQPGST